MSLNHRTLGRLHGPTLVGVVVIVVILFVALSSFLVWKKRNTLKEAMNWNNYVNKRAASRTNNV